jgi:rubrerythrin
VEENLVSKPGNSVRDRPTPAIKKKEEAKAVIEIDEVDDDEPIIVESSFLRPTEVIEPSKSKVQMPNGTREASKGPFAVPSVPASKPNKPLHKTPFFPKEPSPLRQSFAPSPNTSQPDLSSANASTSTTPLPAAPSVKEAASPPDNKGKKRRMTKEEILAIPLDKLPRFEFHWPEVKRDPAKVAAAMAVPIDKLPKFTFPDDCNIHVKATSSIITEPAPSQKPASSFDWAAAGIRPPSASEQWACSTCGLNNPATATEKCTICDAPAPGAAASKPAQKGFDWGAAGMKPTSASGKWTCTTCGLNNPAAVTDKCTICDAPAASKPAQKVFDWGAAGMKLPSDSGSGWTCNLCGLKNPGTQKTKCSVCEAPYTTSV